MIKKKGSRTEPCGRPQKQVWRKEKLLSHLTLKHERTDKTGNSQGQCQLFKITRKDETIRCYAQ